MDPIRSFPVLLNGGSREWYSTSELLKQTCKMWNLWIILPQIIFLHTTTSKTKIIYDPTPYLNPKPRPKSKPDPNPWFVPSASWQFFSSIICQYCCDVSIYGASICRWPWLTVAAEAAIGGKGVRCVWGCVYV